MCLQWAKHSRFDETRNARWSRVTFQQACTVVLGNYNHQVAFRHLPASSSSSSILRVRVSSPSSFAIFQEHLKVLHLRVRVSSPPSFAIFQQHLKLFTLPFRVSTPSNFAISQQHLAAFECLATTRSDFVTFELTQNINTIMCDCILSNLQINLLTAFMNVNFNKMLEQSYAQY